MPSLIFIVARKFTSSIIELVYTFKLPVGTKVSQDCQDLMLALLQRDPMDRISFEDFFAHPFLDLEHVPSPSCLGRAVSVIILINFF